MTAPDEAETAQPTRLEALAVYFKPRVLIVLLLGFSSGLPLALSTSTLAVWLTERNVDIKTIGLFSLVGLPYTFKFFWAPLIDALDVPFLSRWFGRRRGWLVFTQLLLIAAIVFLGLNDPDKSLPLIVFGAVMVATVSATQDIVIDAFRVESLAPNEQGAGMAGYVAAYRIGMLVSGAGVLVLVTWFEHLGIARTAVWGWGYAAAAACMVVGLIATLLAREPEATGLLPHDAAHKPLQRLIETATGAFGEFLSRNGAILILLFVLLYKFCDAFAGALTAAFIIKIGFDKATYAEIVKGVGLAAALIGGFAGGAIARALADVHKPVDRRLPADGVELHLFMAGAGRHQHAGAHLHHHRGKLHRRHRHCDLRRLPLGAVRRARPHRHTICAAYRHRRGGAHGARLWRRLHRRRHRLVLVLRHHRAVRDPQPAAARLAANTRAFQDVGGEEGVTRA